MKTKKIFLTLVICFMMTISYSQTLVVPEASQKAMVMQRIGMTDITVVYHSPLVKDRKVWGELVPYDSVWRAGANENTTISFSTPVKINKQDLAAGTYGLFMIPSASEWTIIFSKNSTSWGAFFYDKSEDVLRVKTKPESTSSSQEWLSYSFSNPERGSGILNLKWEKINVPIEITTNVNEEVFLSMKNELRGLDGFTWEAFNQGARFCLNNNVHLDEGRKWLDRSMGMQENFVNLQTLAKYQEKEGKATEAEATRAKAIKIGNEAQLNMYGYNLIAEKKIQEAINIFSTNVKRYPDSWNVYDSLGEGYDNAGNKKEALKYYKMAREKSPKDQYARIDPIIKRLETEQKGTN